MANICNAAHGMTGVCTYAVTDSRTQDTLDYIWKMGRTAGQLVETEGRGQSCPGQIFTDIAASLSAATF